MDLNQLTYTDKFGRERALGGLLMMGWPVWDVLRQFHWARCIGCDICITLKGQHSWIQVVE